MTVTIPGYTYGEPAVPTSPVTAEELRLLQATLLWTEEDTAALRLAGEVLADQVEDVLDVWYGFVGANPHLVASFAGADGQPDGHYLQRVRARFGQWIRDTCAADYDQAWLDYQHEIARRHTRAGKNATDDLDSTSSHVEMRYLIAFIVPITATMRPFLAKGGHDPDQVEAMHAAWFKAVVLTATLWSRPYAEDW